MDKFKRYSKSYLPSALYPWSFPIMIIVIIISQSCASMFPPFKLKEFYTANESLVPQEKFQQGEKVRIVISGDSPDTQNKTVLIGIREEYKSKRYSYLSETRKTSLHFDIIIKNHATGEEYGTIDRDVYTDAPGLYSATITGYTDTFYDEHKLHRTIQFEVTPKASANLSKTEASKQTFDPANVLTLFDNNIRNDKVKSWLKKLSANSRALRGWDVFSLLHPDLTLYHNTEGDIYSIEFGYPRDYSPEGMPYGLSFSQTRKEIETILGESKKPERVYDLRNGFYPSKLINIQYLSVDSGSKPYEIQFYKEGFYNESF